MTLDICYEAQVAYFMCESNSPPTRLSQTGAADLSDSNIGVLISIRVVRLLNDGKNGRECIRSFADSDIRMN